MIRNSKIIWSVFASFDRVPNLSALALIFYVPASFCGGWVLMKGSKLMRRYEALRSTCKLLALLGVALFSMGVVRAQESGGDLGGGAGIFRPKNPETKKRTTGIKPPTATGRTTGTGRTNTGTVRPVALPPEVIEERFEDALGEGNTARDARKYADAEKAYRNAGQLKPKDWRGWYGLGNIYTDQQRWDDAEKA